MSNSTKIKTMKDDLLEIENKVSQSIEVPEKQQKSATLSSGSLSALPDQKPGAGFYLPKTAPKNDDSKTKELRNIVDRLSKKKPENAAESTAEKIMPLYNSEIKTSTSEANELKALIDRISKREGGREKPLTVFAEKEKEKLPGLKPVEEPQIAAVKKEAVEEPLVTAKQEPTKTMESQETSIQNEVPLEKPDLDALIKPVSKPAPKPSEKKPIFAPETKIRTEIKSKNVSSTQPPIPRKNDSDFEEKTEEIKKILNNIAKKESELKNLLEKMSEKKEAAIASSEPEAKTIPQEPGMSSGLENARIEKTAAPRKKSYLEKLIEPVEKLSLKPLEKKEASITPPEQKTIPEKKEQANKEKPIMKKIRERLFGMEKEISETKLKAKESPTPAIKSESEAAEKLSKKEKTAGREEKNATRKVNIETKDYLKEIAREKISSAPKIEGVEEKFSNLPRGKQASGMKPEKISEFENTSGIIKSSAETETKKEDKLAKARRNYLDSQYVSPTNRLVFGKQEHYSSIRKHIEERRLNENLKDLESKVRVSKNIILSEKEEKKRLKERIISKYHIRSSPFLRNVLIVAVIAIAIGGAALYNYLSNIETKPPETMVPVVAGSELKELSAIKESVEITAEKLKNPVILRDEANKKFLSDPNLKFFKLIIKDDKGNIVKLKDALEGVGISTGTLPQTFLESAENEYGFLVFKTLKFTTRLGIAIKLKSPEAMQSTMNDWEKDRVKMKDALNPLFVSDRSSDIRNSYFQAGSYKNVGIRYVSLPDKNTAIDYFIYKNILVIATTKDDTFALIDMLIAAK